ncbi:MAG: hypothetical protein V8R40_13250 [Dysosmobacter sp.]
MKMEELDRVISQAGKAVSALVNYPAYVTAAGRKKSVRARRFELLPVDEHSCIVVMMLETTG